MSASLPVQLRNPNLDDVPHSGRFQPGHPRYGGRRKGSRNKVGGDLREAIVAAIQATGFIEKDEKGNPIATGKGGCQGFVQWLALYEPKTAAALFARVLPYFITVGETPPVASREVQLRNPILDDVPHSGRFQPGHPRYGGRRKGSRNKVGGDLREAIVAAIQATGFIEKDEHGQPKATGRGGCQGFIEWLALHEPKTAAALFARVLPYFINVGMEVPEVVSEAEMEAMLKELGLPLGLIQHMQTAPAPLDLDEDPDPYGMDAEAAKDVPDVAAEHMQTAPAPLDIDEDPDPYGMDADAAKNTTDVAAE